jgi:microcystin-dependent protein
MSSSQPPGPKPYVAPNLATHGPGGIAAAIEEFVRSTRFAEIVRGQYPEFSYEVPHGVVMPFMGPETSVPKDYLLCDGREVPRSVHPKTFAAIGTTYGTPSNPTMFKLPDLRGRAPFGLDNMGGTDAGRLSVPNQLGGTGGEEKHALTRPEIPSHVHYTGNGQFFATSNQVVQAGSGASFAAVTGFVATTDPGDELGGSAPLHNNMPPYILVNWIMRAG